MTKFQTTAKMRSYGGNCRNRGLSDIWATLLGIIVGLGILGSVMLVYRQATFSTRIA